MKGPIAGAVIANAVIVDSGTASKTEPANAKNNNAAESVPVDLLVNPIANVQSALEKKLRNLGKRTQKLQQIKLDRANGIKLTEEQLDAISKAGEVELQVEFIKDLQKLATQQVRQYQRAARQKDDALTKKTQENNLNLVNSVLKYQEVLKVFANGGLSDNDSTKLTTAENDAFAKLHSELTATVSGFKSFGEYETQMNNFAKKMKDICSGSVKEVEANVTGLRLQTLFNQIFESPALKSSQTKTETVVVPDANTNEEGVESDESSLNDFHQDSVDSSNDCPDGKVAEEKTTEQKTAVPETTASNNTVQGVKKAVSVSSLASPPAESVPEISAPVETAPEASVEPTPTPAQPDTTPTTNKDNAPDSKLKEPVNGEHRNRRSGQNNNYHRNRRDYQHKSQNQQSQATDGESVPSQVTNSHPAKPQYNRGGPRPHNNSYKSRRNSVPNNNNDQEGFKPSSDAANANTARTEVAHQAPRRSEGQRPRFFRNDTNNGEGGNSGGNNGMQNRRPYVPRNQQGGNGDQYQAQRNGGPSNGGGGYAPRNYERVPRVHQPYECGLRFARD